MIKLINGDCLEEMRKIEDGSIDMILCDLPYGTTNCKWDIVLPFDKLWEQYNRIIKPNGAIVLFGTEPFSSLLRCSNIKFFKYDWIWAKSRATGHLNSKKQPLRDCEVISVFYKKQCTYNPQGLKEGVYKNHRDGKKGSKIYGQQRAYGDSNVGGYPRTVLKVSNGNHNNYHPTQKPIELLEYLIKTYTNEGETVLDNTMGVGSCGVATVNTNRKFIGIELDENYFEIAEKRIKEAKR